VTVVGRTGDEAGQTIASDDGAFALEDVAEGTYTVVAAAPNYRAAANVVAVQPPETRTAVSLLGTGSLVGKVARARDGSPLEAHIDLLNNCGAVAVECQSGKDGAFVIPDLLEGDYELIAVLAGYRAAPTPVAVRRGSTEVTRLDLTGVGHLYGAVSGPHGGWLPGVSVTLTDSSGKEVASTSTDDAGSYHFGGVPEGAYTVCVPSSARARATADVRVGSTLAIDLTLEAGRED
jgi:hypothetical protein